MITIKLYTISMQQYFWCGRIIHVGNGEKEFSIHMLLLCFGITTLLYTRVRVKNVSISIKNENDLNMKY